MFLVLCCMSIRWLLFREWEEGMEILLLWGKPSCDSQDYMNNIDMFCVQCKSFMCNTCNNAHAKHEATHSNLPIVVGRDKSLKGLCDTHNTTCKYTCCNKHTCTYCIHRDRAKHNYIHLDDETKNISYC